MRSPFFRFYLFLFLATLTTFSAQSQNSNHPVSEILFPTPDTYLFPHEYPTHYLLGDQVAMRKIPHNLGDLIAILSIGEKLNIKQRSDSTETINGLTAHWYKVNAKQLEGWIWGGYIAQFATRSNTQFNTLILGGLHHSDKDASYFNNQQSYRLRAVKNQKLIDEIVVSSFAHGYDHIAEFGNLGVPEIDLIFTLHVPCVGGCGCSTGDSYVFWNGKKFFHPMDGVGMADADYSENKRYIFPKSLEGKKDLIICEETYPVEVGNGENQKLYREIKKTYYKWNGNQLILAGLPQETQRYEQK